MSTHPEQQTEQPGPDRESSALTRLSEEQLKIALTEMADSDPTFLQHLFKQAATTEDGCSPSPPKDGPGTSNPSGNNNVAVEWVDTFKYLGVRIHPKLR